MDANMMQSFLDFGNYTVWHVAVIVVVMAILPLPVLIFLTCQKKYSNLSFLKKSGTKVKAIVMAKQIKVIKKEREKNKDRVDQVHSGMFQNNNQMFGKNEADIEVSYKYELFVSYSFKDDKGVAYKKRLRFPTELASKIVEGGEIEIVYDKAKPSVNIPEMLLDTAITSSKKAMILGYFICFLAVAGYSYAAMTGQVEVLKQIPLKH